MPQPRPSRTGAAGFSTRALYECADDVRDGSERARCVGGCSEALATFPFAAPVSGLDMRPRGDHSVFTGEYWCWAAATANTVASVTTSFEVHVDAVATLGRVSTRSESLNGDHEGGWCSLAPVACPDTVRLGPVGASVEPGAGFSCGVKRRENLEQRFFAQRDQPSALGDIGGAEHSMDVLGEL